MALGGIVVFNFIIWLSAKSIYERFSWVVSNTAPRPVNVVFKAAKGLFPSFYAEFPSGAIEKLPRGLESVTFIPRGRAQKALFDGEKREASVYMDPLTGFPAAISCDGEMIFRDRTVFRGRPKYEKQQKLQRLMARCVAGVVVAALLVAYFVFQKDINWLVAGTCVIAKESNETRFETAIKSFEYRSNQYQAQDVRRWVPNFVRAFHEEERKKMIKAIEPLTQVIEGRKIVGMKADGVIGVALGLRGRYQLVDGNYQAAQEDLKQAVSILGSPDLNVESMKLPIIGPWSVPFGTGPDLRISALKQLAAACEAGGNVSEAENALVDAKSFEEARGGGKLIGTLDVDLAAFYHRHGNKKKGDDSLAAALALLEKDQQFESKAPWYEYWALRLRDHADYDCAAILYEKALKARQAEEKPSPGLIGRDFNELGDCYIRLGRFAEAEKSFKSGLVEYKKVYRAGDPELTWPTVGLAVVAYGSGKPFPVADVTAALTQRIKSNGARTTQTARIMHVLANYYRDTGNIPEAAEFYKQALDIRKTALRYAHPVTVETILDYAKFLDKTGKHSEAVAQEKEAMKLKRLCFI